MRHDEYLDWIDPHGMTAEEYVRAKAVQRSQAYAVRHDLIPRWTPEDEANLARRVRALRR